MAYDKWFDSEQGDRIIYGTTPEQDMTRIYLSEDKDATRFGSTRCISLGVLFFDATQEQVEIFVQGYYSGVERGRLQGREQLRNELHKLIG